MIDPNILVASAGAAFLYVASPGPAFLALFSLSAAKGRTSGAWFIGGHLLGDVTWGALAVASIVGADNLGATLFQGLGLACGIYLVYLGFRALTASGQAPPLVIGESRPLATGLAFGLSNPKAYPVALALFSTIIAPYVDRLGVADMPILMGSALIGFLLADATLIFAAGLPMVRRFFLRHGRILTRFVGLLFIGFGARSIFDAASSAMRRA